MRPPVRAVGDDHVDRPEVERRRRRGRPVLMARGLPAGRGAGAWGAAAARGAGPGPAGGRAARPPHLPPPLPSAWRPAPAAVPSLWHGGHRGGAPPLPIPNRAVKPARADGTARDGRESRSPPPCAPGPLDPGAFFCVWDTWREPNLPVVACVLGRLLVSPYLGVATGCVVVH